MERNPGGETSHSSEFGESLHINIIVIPVDEAQPLRQSQLPNLGLQERQDLVGGLIEGVDLIDPAARLYCNEEGKVLDLPVNRRATLLVWAHNPAFRYRDAIVGDAFLVGPVGQTATETDAPKEYLTRLFEAAHFRIAVKLTGSPGWHPQPERFDRWDTAYQHALGWGVGASTQPNTEIADVRVIPER